MTKPKHTNILKNLPAGTMIEAFDWTKACWKVGRITESNNKNKLGVCWYQTDTGYRIHEGDIERINGMPTFMYIAKAEGRRGGTMTKPKHTPEPWRVSVRSNSRGMIQILAGRRPGLPKPYNFSQVAVIHAKAGASPRSAKERLATALRIVACVNACAGLNPDAIPEILIYLKKHREHIRSIGDRQLPREAYELDKLIAKAEGR